MIIAHPTRFRLQAMHTNVPGIIYRQFNMNNNAALWNNNKQYSSRFVIVYCIHWPSCRVTEGWYTPHTAAGCFFCRMNRMISSTAISCSNPRVVWSFLRPPGTYLNFRLCAIAVLQMRRNHNIPNMGTGVQTILPRHPASSESGCEEAYMMHATLHCKGLKTTHL